MDPTGRLRRVYEAQVSKPFFRQSRSTTEKIQPAKDSNLRTAAKHSQHALKTSPASSKPQNSVISQEELYFPKDSKSRIRHEEFEDEEFEEDEFYDSLGEDEQNDDYAEGDNY